MNSPYLAKKNSVGQVMGTVLAAMTLGIVFSVHMLGIGVLVQIFLSVLTALIAETLMLRWRKLPVRPYLLDGSATVTAVIIGVAFPALGAWWLVVLATLFAIVVIKHLYGGLGNNLFNPAMGAYAFMLISFPAQLSQWSSFDHGLSAYEQLMWIFLRELPAPFTLDAISSATPLDHVRTQLLNGTPLSTAMPQSTLSTEGLPAHLALGLAWLIGGLYLWRQKIIDLRAPLAMLLSLALLASIFHTIDSERYPDALFHLFHGATMLGAWFIVTDPVSCSTTPRGKLLFGIGVGVMVFVIRTWGNFPDAVAFAILIMNMCVPFIDLYTRPPAFGKSHSKGKS